MMRIKLDENLPRRLKEILASLRHDVARVEDEHLLAQWWRRPPEKRIEFCLRLTWNSGICGSTRLEPIQA